MIVIIVTIIIGTTVKIMHTGGTWWSIIELTGRTTISEPGISATIGSGGTNIPTAKRDTKRDKFRVSVTVGETVMDASPW